MASHAEYKVYKELIDKSRLMISAESKQGTRLAEAKRELVDFAINDPTNETQLSLLALRVQAEYQKLQNMVRERTEVQRQALEAAKDF